ncbi:extracellular solute-binding protein [Paenibacillus sp. N1-5-1-14]|nr:extracellular solute-binding protein [Paenibacillus radicibacter]MCR8644903.1 extracellular solute-binding protein [Paenibacillus radicibacter]
MKKIGVSLISMSLLLSFTLVGCSQRSETASTTKSEATTVPTPTAKSGDSGNKKKVTVYSSVTLKSIQDVYRQIATDFSKDNADIEVDLQFPGSGYENLLKVKMAANDLPDIFDTHGWAQIRYGNYLADLQAEPWAKEMTDTIKDVVTDKNGKVYALVLAEAKDGLTYNVDVLKKYNIEPPKTFDELMAAAEKLKLDSKGEVTPFYFSGVDDWLIGQYFDYFATSAYISPKDNDAKSLLDGTFDWRKWDGLSQKFLDMFKKGYMNKDVITAKYSDLPQLFAQGKVAFALQGPSIADEVHKVKADTKIGFMPVPSMVQGDEPNFSGGERYTMGVFKDSKQLEASKKVVAFFARKENMSKIANTTKLPAGLKGIESNHEFSEYYNKYASIRVFPYFDRVYLPNGMWDVMCKTATSMLSGGVSPAQFSDKMKQEVERLRK